MNASYERILRYFKYSHLPTDLQSISKPCCDLAKQMVVELDGKAIDPAEVTVGLRKLLEAKDAFVRSIVP